jgi:hypothetical protein
MVTVGGNNAIHTTEFQLLVYLNNRVPSEKSALNVEKK